MNRSDKYRQTIIKRYGSWAKYLKERKKRMIEKHGSEEAVIEIHRALSSKGGKNSTSRPFRDVEGLASKASKLRTGKDRN